MYKARDAKISKKKKQKLNKVIQRRDNDSVRRRISK